MSNEEKIQKDILKVLDSMISDARKYNFLKKTKDESVHLEMSPEVKSLISAGFTQHKLVVEYNQLLEKEKAKRDCEESKRSALNESVRALRILNAARQYYGDGTLYLPIDAFMSLCEKYNLRCDTFKNYKGDLSMEWVEHVIDLKHSYSQLSNIISLRRVTNIGNNYRSWGDEEEAEVRKRFKRFPFVQSAEGFRGRRVVHADGTSVRYEYVEIEVGEENRFFIVAPKNMFNSEYISEIENPLLLVCSFTENGAIIFTNWDKEGSYSVSTRLEDLSIQLKVLKI